MKSLFLKTFLTLSSSLPTLTIEPTMFLFTVGAAITTGPELIKKLVMTQLCVRNSNLTFLVSWKLTQFRVCVGRFFKFLRHRKISVPLFFLPSQSGIRFPLLESNAVSQRTSNDKMKRFCFAESPLTIILREA